MSTLSGVTSMHSNITIDLITSGLLSMETINHYNEVVEEDYNEYPKLKATKIIKIIKEFYILLAKQNNSWKFDNLTQNLQLINDNVCEIDMEFYYKMITYYAELEVNYELNDGAAIQMIEELVSMKPQNICCETEILSRLLGLYNREPFKHIEELKVVKANLDTALEERNKLPEYVL